MKIEGITNTLTCELEMQDAFKIWLAERNIIHCDEVFVSKVNRRADFLLYQPGKGLINVEAKSFDFAKIIEQLDDHALYCDYCFAFIPDYAATPRKFKQRLSVRGFGLIVWNTKLKVITEVLEAHYNKPFEKEIRKQLIEKLQQNENS